MKKFLFVTVPMCSTHFPDLAVPSLIAQLRKNNYDVNVLDFNIDFLREIYTTPYLQSAFDRAYQQYQYLKNTEKKSSLGFNNKCEYNISSLKYKTLDEFFSNHQENAKKRLCLIENAIKILKTEDLFYNPKLLQFAHKMLHYANKVAFLPYAPFEYYDFDGVYYEDVCKIIFDKSQNIYMEYFESKIKEIIDLNPNFVGISVSYGQQVLAALTLAYLLKKNTDAHICIGGNYFSRLTDYIPNYKDFFELFADSVSFAEGENAIIDLARYINDEIKISEVSQLMYKDKYTAEIRINEVRKPVFLSEIVPPDFEDYSLDKYLLPQRILPLQVQRGCYWNKCAFCSMTYKKTKSSKKVEAVVNELKNNREKYGVTSYFIVDESITISYLEELVDLINSNDLNLKFMLSLRLEEEITRELLEKLYKAGVRSIWWGVESANERVLNLMKKGINIKIAKNILKMSDAVGISNFCLFINSFPTASYDEDMDTLNFIDENIDVIHNFKTSRYLLVKNSRVYYNPEDYGIIRVEDKKKSRISVFYEYKRETGMKEEESLCFEQKLNAYYNEKIKYIFAPVYHFLYYCKFGLKETKAKILNRKDDIV